MRNRIYLAIALLTFSFSIIRMGSSLDALAHGYGSLAVGVLISLLAAFPALLSLSWGRWMDREGERKPVLVAGIFTLLGLVIPAALPTGSFGLVPLGLGCCFAGIGLMSASLSSQRMIGALSSPETRLANFAWLATATAAAGFAGPIAAGFVIDRAGHQAAFALGAAVALLGLAATIDLSRRLPRAPGSKANKKKTGAFDLFRHPPVRNVLIISAMVTIAWDLQTFVFPVYGNAVGLTATEIGWLVGTFYAATFFVRLVMPFVSGRVSEWQFMVFVMLMGAAAYFLFPFFTSMPPLLVCAFVLGTGLGASQPNVMSLLQTQSPEGRTGEAIGLRSMLTQAGHAALPLAFGALASVAGVFWIFMAMAGALGAAALFAQTIGRSQALEEPKPLAKK